MTDLSKTIDPKSDQLNSDDLICGPMTISISKVGANPASPEQPISIFFDGDNGKPYKPCKSMRRVLVNAWGSDGSKFPGRAMTLYRDPTVKFGGLEVGGIRISHMSDIDKQITMALTATRANRKPYTVKPLQRVERIAGTVPAHVPNADTLALAREAATGGSDVFATWWKGATKDERADATTIIDELKKIRAEADEPAHDPQTGELQEMSAADAFGQGTEARAAGHNCDLPMHILDAGGKFVDAYMQGWASQDETMKGQKP